MHNSTFYESMDPFDETDDPSQLLMKEITSALDGSFEGYQDLQSKYSNLHETYAKEIQNSKKVEKCLVKCLKFYSKLCKKYEAQQKVISHLKESINEKMNSLEESLKTQEKLKGLIEIYRSERTHYSGMSNQNLRRDKEILLNICCRLISESVKNNSIRNLTNIILKKFKKDLDNEKLTLLKGKEFSVKNEGGKIKKQDLDSLGDVKPSDLQDFTLENKMNVIYGVSDAKLDINNVVAKTETKDEEELGLSSEQPKENSAYNEDFSILNVLEEDNLCTKEIYVVSPRREDELLPSSDNDLIFGDMPLLESSEFHMSTSNGKSTEFHSGSTYSGVENMSCDLGLNLNVSNSMTSRVTNEMRRPETCELPYFGEAVGEVKFHSDNIYDHKNSNDESSSMSYSQPRPLREKEVSKEGNLDCASDEENESSNFFAAENEKSGSISSPVSSPKLESFFSNRSSLDEPDVTKRKSAITVINKRALSKSRDYTRKPKKTITPSSISGIPDIGNSRKNPNAVGENLLENKISSNLLENRFEQTPFDVISNEGSVFDIPREVGLEGKESKISLKDSIDNGRQPTDANVSEKSKEQRFEVLPPFSLGDSFFDIPEERSDSDILSERVVNGEKTEKPEAITDFLLAPTELNEGELLVIFKEMSHVRLLSPIREISSSSVSCNLPRRIENNLFNGSDLSRGNNTGLGKRSSKATTGLSEMSSKNKKLKPDESRAAKKKENGGLLDSIISAMSIQNEEFKAKPAKEHLDPSIQKVDENISVRSDACKFPESGRKYCTRAKTRAANTGGSLKQIGETAGPCKNKETLIEKVVLKEIKKFVSCSISSNEDADWSVKQCVSILTKKPQEVIARSIVTIVLENIDEDLEMFERPAPPLTRTQHRLIVLLSVLKKVEPAADKIPSIILSIIFGKFFPDTFFWPDDCVETTTRFYAALCKMGNDPKTLWKFCLEAMTEMKQRCCLVVFTALKTWPDILFDASSPHNNILAVTVVQVFLHMPKADGLRNFNQKKKLTALKHLLINFYQFKVENTIETYAQKVFDSVLNKVVGSGKALALLAKSRDWNWTSKNILPKLEQGLKDWIEDKLEDSLGIEILSVIKQISPLFVLNGGKAKAKVVEIISCLSSNLASGKLNHGSEQNMIEILLQMKEFPEARTVIREWVPRAPVSDRLRDQVISVSAQNILREVKLNRTSERKGLIKFRKQAKKSKGKKKKGKSGKKRKNNKEMGIKGTH